MYFRVMFNFSAKCTLFTKRSHDLSDEVIFSLKSNLPKKVDLFC